MRLYLEAESKNKVGYTPDWLKVSYYENGERMELTLDIPGDIGYDIDCLSCRCKGDLIPWVLYNCESGDETDFYSDANLTTVVGQFKYSGQINGCKVMY